MIRKATIGIPTPCHENWDEMAVADKTRFCGSCQKHVYDFTKSSDREILNKISDGQHCGRFHPSQLNRELISPKEKTSIWLAAASGALAFLNLGSYDVYSQDNKVQVENHPLYKDGVCIISPRSTIPTKIVSGTVSDEAGVLPGVNIIIKGTNVHTETDFDGKFCIEAKKSDVIEFSFIGMQTKEIEVGNLDSVQINLMMDGMRMGLIEVKRSFFGRIGHSISNLFR